MKFQENVSLKKYNTFKVGGNAKYLFEPIDTNELIDGLNYISEKDLKYYVLGLGSNVLLPDEDFDGVIIVLKNIDKIEIENNILTVGAGTALPYLNTYLLEKGFTNFMYLSGIPGTIGGAICINASAHGYEILKDLRSVLVLKDGQIVNLTKNEITYGYRYTNLNEVIVLEATFDLHAGHVEEAKEEIKKIREERIKKQPLDKPSAGSVFKNPELAPAGKLIENAGLKGLKIGGAKISDKHANFIINDDNATSNDILKLIDLIKKEVLEKFKVDLETEVKIVNWDSV